VPFLLLLARRNKRSVPTLTGIALALVLLRWTDLYWLIAPAFREAMGIHWLDLALPAGIGSVWIALFLRQLRRGRLLPADEAGT
jgi:hypothetical protein